MFWFFGPKICEILAPWLGIEPAPPALEGEVFNHWTPREVPTNQCLVRTVSMIYYETHWLLYYEHIGPLI